MKKINKSREEQLDKMLQDADKWDNRELGADPDYAEIANEYKKSRASIVTTIRMTPSMVRELKKIADDEGLPYQTLIKSVLTQHISSKKSA